MEKKKLSKLVAVTALLLLLPVAAAEETPETNNNVLMEQDETVEEARGNILYLPTVEQADRILEEQMPSGLAPEPGSAVGAAAESAGKLLVLSAAYKHTGDDKYMKGYQSLASALEDINRTNGYIPRYFWLSGTPLVTHGDGGKVADALVLSRLMTNESLPTGAEATVTVTVDCAFEEEAPVETNETGANETETCPYEISEEEEEGEEEITKNLVYLAGNEKRLTVTYTLEPGALAKEEIDPQDINIQKVTAIDAEGLEVIAEPDSCVEQGIQREVAKIARKATLNVIADELLTSDELSRGFSSTHMPLEWTATALERAAYQARLIVQGKDSVPWDVVFEPQPREANKYLRLAEEYSLLQGAMYIRHLGADRETWDYDLAPTEDLTYAETSDNLQNRNGSLRYRHQGTEPRFEGLAVDYRPVRERRVHVAGSIDALLEAKFGARLGIHQPVTLERLPAGEYQVTVNREKVFPYEDLSGKVTVQNTRYPSRNAQVLYTTLTMAEATRAIGEAVREEDPEKLFIAVDNMYMQRIGMAEAPLGSGAPGTLKAMYSLSDRDIEEVADDSPRLANTLRKWKDFYAEKSLRRVKGLVRISLGEDAYSEDTERLLWRLATEANRTGLSSAGELNDLYAGYREYFGPHTKNYENLKALAEHLQEYDEIVDAIESGEHDRARELIAELPSNSTASRILSEQLGSAMESTTRLKQDAYEEIRVTLRGEGGNIGESVRKLQRYLELAEDDEAEYVLGVAKAYQKGVLNRGAALDSLSELEYFHVPVKEEPPTKPEVQPEKNVTEKPELPEKPPSDQEGKGKLFAALLGIAVVLTITVLAMRWARRRRPRRR